MVGRSRRDRVAGRALGVALLAIGAGACTALTGASELTAVADANGEAGASSSGSSSGDPRAPRSDAGQVVDRDAGSSGVGSDGGDAGKTGCTVRTYGPRTPATAFGPDWTTAGSSRVVDTRVAHGTGVLSPLIVSGFGFAIPTSATILGIEVTIYRSCIGVVADKGVSLSKGDAKSKDWVIDNDMTAFPPAVFGGPADLWGATWTADEIMSQGFTVSQVVNGAGDAHIDGISVSVTVCE